MAIGTEGGGGGFVQMAEATAGTFGQEGLMVARITIPPPRQQETIQWHMPLPDVDLTGAKWVLDGSLLDGPRRATRRPGFAMLLLSPRDTPLALVSGTPPDWIHTANGAEAWGLLQVLHHSIGSEFAFTDCKSLLSSLQLGVDTATAAGRSMARVWAMIFHVLDDQGTNVFLSDEQRYVWLPAHTSATAIGRMRMSSGQAVTPALWRANRLVDVVAKSAARQHTVGPAVLEALKLAEAAALHGAAVSGMVARAANHYRVEAGEWDGTTKVTFCRDSAPHVAPSRPQEASATWSKAASATGRPSGSSASTAPTPQVLARAHANRVRALAAETDS